jgi:hypothetical protein
MPKAYWIATYRSINDLEALVEYAKLAVQAIWPRADATWLRGTPAKCLRREWTCARSS